MKKTIEIFGEIDQYTFNSVHREVEKIIKENYTDDIIIIINSTGGSCDHTFAIVDILNLLPNKLIGVVVGFCGSCADIILLNCTKRYMTKNSKFMFHGVLSNFKEGAYSNEVLDTLYFENDYYTKKIYKVLSQKTNIPKKALKNVKRSAVFNNLNAKKCLKYGVIDKIITNISELNLQTNTKKDIKTE